MKNLQTKINDSAKKIASDNQNNPLAMTNPNIDTLQFVVITQASVINTQRKLIFGMFAVALFASLTALVSISQDPDKPSYFGQTAEGYFTKLTPLSEPIANLTKMRLWADACMIDLLDIGFAKPIEKTNIKLNRCFTNNGRSQFIKWLTVGTDKKKVAIGNGKVFLSVDSELGNIIVNKITLDASLKSPSTITVIAPDINKDTGEKEGRWQVKMPVIIRSIKGNEGEGVSVFNITVILKRVNDVGKEEGVAIDGFSIAKAISRV